MANASDDQLYMKYIEKYGYAAKQANHLINFGKSQNHAISYKNARFLLQNPPNADKQASQSVNASHTESKPNLPSSKSTKFNATEYIENKIKKKKSRNAVTILYDVDADKYVMYHSNQKEIVSLPIINSNTEEIEDRELLAEIEEKDIEINKSLQPQFATKAPEIIKNYFKIRVAIDFGTDGIGTCYVYQ